MAQFASAFGEGGQHGVAVGNRFVAGRSDSPGELLRWLDCAFFHERILACRHPRVAVGTNLKKEKRKEKDNAEALRAPRIAEFQNRCLYQGTVLARNPHVTA